MSKKRILFVSPGPMPPSTNKGENKYFLLSEEFTGAIVSTRWGKKDKAEIKKVSEACGNFSYHAIHTESWPWFFKVFLDVAFFFFKGLYLHYFVKKFDFVVVYGPFKTAIAAYLVKLFTGAKLIVDVPGNPFASFSYTKKSLGLVSKLKRALSKPTLSFVLSKADKIKLLYPTQLGHLGDKYQSKTSVFLDFVPTNLIASDKAYRPYILFIGFPWYLKGVDLLIKSFISVSEKYPEYQLKIMGYCPEPEYFYKLAEGNSRIEFLKPRPWREAMELMEECSLFVLPSRTEAMGRVLLEAMAAKRPIVASRVDGIPYYVEDKKTGLLFESGNVDDLAEKIENILSDKELREGLTESAYDRVEVNYSPSNYLKLFKKMCLSLS